MKMNNRTFQFNDIKVFLRWALISSLIFVFFTLLVQFFIWRQYSFEASYLQLKSLVAKKSIEPNLALGAIRNSLSDFQGAIKYFSAVVDSDPTNQAGLSNLAFALARVENYKKAKSVFDAYFTVGGNSFDTFFWYGKTLSSLGQKTLGQDWEYYSLKLNPNYTEASRALVNELFSQDKFEEALSLIGASSRGNSEANSYWSDLLVSDAVLKKPNIEDKTHDLNLVSLDSINYFVPVKLAANSRIKFFSFNENFRDNFVSLDLLDELLIRIPQNSSVKMVELQGKSTEVLVLELENFVMGRKVISKAVFYTCKTCPNVFGSDFFKTHTRKKTKRFNTDFMTVNL